VHWRLNEEARADALHSRERFRHAFDDAPIGMALTGSTASSSAPTPCSASASAPTRPAGRWPTSSMPTTWPADRSPPAAARSRCATPVRPHGGCGTTRCSPGADDRPEAWISHCIDVSQRRLAEDELSWQANHDALTGLPNRELFLERLSGSLGSEGRVAVLLVDLDDFKVVNDSLGHAAGDRLLSGVAERLCRVLRPGDVIARFGGDEFTILLPGITDEAYALGVARRLAEALREPLVLDGERRYVTASVGVSFSAASEHDPHALLR
jgi:diguanylate cyclase (GGDEF)-like protein